MNKEKKIQVKADKPKLAALLKKLPAEPGVYQFKDEHGQILYVGKAKNLKNRVRSYFQKQKGRAVRTQKLIERTADLEWTEASSDLEAIMLEANLIKELRPRYNVLMKDDKNFVYIKVTKGEDYPRVKIVRKVEKDGARYFGPKTAAGKAKKTLVLMQKLFKYRSCDLGIDFIRPGEADEDGEVKITKKTIAYPCLDFHIKRCEAPCLGKVTPEEYGEAIRQIELFLEGKTGEIEKTLKVQMAELVAERKFERAALLRDRLEAVHDLAQRQLVSSPDHANMDVFGFVIEGATAYFTLFMFRDGKFVNQENFVADSGGFGASEEGQAGELMESFLYQYYERAADKPQQVLVPVALMGEEKEFFEEWSGVKLLVPQRGKKHKIIELARKNAESFMKQHKARFEVAKRDDKEALLRLAEELERGGLELGGPPKRIEAYDVSHLGGTDTVASMVVFEHGAPKKSDYRKFRLKTIEEGEVDDYKSMREVLRRRFSRLRKDVVVRQASKSREKDILRFLKAGWDQDERFGTLKEYYLAFVDKKPIGMCRMLPSGVNKGELEAGLFLLEVLFVEEDFRGKGIAKTVLRHAIEKSGGKRVYLFCEQKMTEFYKKFGFKEIKKFPEIFMGRANNFENNTGQKPHFMAFDPNNLKDASFKARPDLVLIDGGKGQLGVALQVWDEFGLDIPVIGLAKREEEIFMPEGEAGARKVKNKPLLLPPDSKALYLLQRVRDEAHRFAITFQKKSRKKHIRKSVLDSILGLGEGGKMALLQKFGSVDQIADASEWEVAEIVGSKLAKAVMDALV